MIRQVIRRRSPYYRETAKSPDTRLSIMKPPASQIRAVSTGSSGLWSFRSDVCEITFDSLYHDIRDHYHRQAFSNTVSA
jgi:hypothetical protein